MVYRYQGYTTSSQIRTILDIKRNKLEVIKMIKIPALEMALPVPTDKEKELFDTFIAPTAIYRHLAI